MKKPFFILISCFLAACSGVMPYKDQNLDYLYGIQKDPSAYKGAVVAFNGEVAGIRESAQSIRLILRIDTPLYYYATGKGNSLSYEMLYVRFEKEKPRMTGIAKEHKVKVLGRVDGYEQRKDGLGNAVGVVRLNAVALADRKQNKDFHRTDAASAALYQSWKKGKLFFEESAEQVLSRVPAPAAKPQPAAPAENKTAPAAQPPQAEPTPQPAKGIVFDAEEPPFILPPDPQEKPVPSAENDQTAPAEQAPALQHAPAGKDAAAQTQEPQTTQTPPAETVTPETKTENSGEPVPQTAEAPSVQDAPVTP